MLGRFLPFVSIAELAFKKYTAISFYSVRGNYYYYYPYRAPSRFIISKRAVVYNNTILNLLLIVLTAIAERSIIGSIVILDLVRVVFRTRT